MVRRDPLRLLQGKNEELNRRNCRANRERISLFFDRGRIWRIFWRFIGSDCTPTAEGKKVEVIAQTRNIRIANTILPKLRAVFAAYR